MLGNEKGKPLFCHFRALTILENIPVCLNFYSFEPSSGYFLLLNNK